jgi:hypothetical protein|tara:strand:+ start:161 stop:334 length:174 start_codon:yes stop_codon:yes gene_type:complete
MGASSSLAEAIGGRCWLPLAEGNLFLFFISFFSFGMVCVEPSTIKVKPTLNKVKPSK